jgi:hypothetical protein
MHTAAQASAVVTRLVYALAYAHAIEPCFKLVSTSSYSKATLSMPAHDARPPSAGLRLIIVEHNFLKKITCRKGCQCLTMLTPASLETAIR